MKLIKVVVLCLLLPFTICMPTQLGAQTHVHKKVRFLKNSTDKRLFEEAEELFDNEEYLSALQLYRKLEERFPNELVLRYKTAVCMLSESTSQALALDQLKALDQYKLRKTDIHYYLGCAYHINYKFNEAIEHFNLYIQKKPGTPLAIKAIRYIENCRNGLELMKDSRDVKIRNISAPINTGGAEYVPVISSDESVLIFTYRGEKCTGGKMNQSGEPDPNGEYYEDILISHREGNRWSEPVSIGDNINTNEHDAAIALSNDGQKLFIYKSTAYNDGDIYMSTLQGDQWSSPEPLRGDINSPFWEGSVSLSSDERTIFFSSDRPGGFGGRDIYSATLLPDGTWGNVKNLGPRINTLYDDDAPFIHPDGRLFHFSSQGHNSIGGYDVFRTVLEIDSTWREVENLGYPINTTGDDIYYVVAGDGQRGYYSSAKPGGNGQQDIYIVEPGVQGLPTRILAVKGKITMDCQPAEASVQVKYQGEDKVLAEYHSNAISGQYLVNLPVGKKYTLVYKIGQSVMKKDIDATDIESFIGTEEDKNFFTNTLRPLACMKDSLMLIPGELDPELQMPFMDVVKLFGNVSSPGLTFSVQIGAYSLPDNFKYSKLAGLGKIEVSRLQDGVSRFTLGRFDTLAQADALREKVVNAGIKDAFVIAVYNGKRVLMKEIVKKNFFMQ